MLGLLHVQVPRADDHVHGLDGLGAEREGGDRLGAPHAVDAGDPAQAAGAEDHRIDVPVGPRGGAHGHVDDPGGAGADDPHHDGARVGGAAGGNVDGGRQHRDLAEGDLVALGKAHGAVGVDPGLGHQGDVGDRDLESRDQLQGQLGDGGVELLGGDPERTVGGVGCVEGAGVAGHRGVALGLDGVDDRGDVVGHRGGPGDHLAKACGHRPGAELGERRGVDPLAGATVSLRLRYPVKKWRPGARGRGSGARRSPVP